MIEAILVLWPSLAWSKHAWHTLCHFFILVARTVSSDRASALLRGESGLLFERHICKGQDVNAFGQSSRISTSSASERGSYRKCLSIVFYVDTLVCCLATSVALALSGQTAQTHFGIIICIGCLAA